MFWIRKVLQVACVQTWPQIRNYEATAEVRLMCLN